MLISSRPLMTIRTNNKMVPGVLGMSSFPNALVKGFLVRARPPRFLAILFPPAWYDDRG